MFVRDAPLKMGLALVSMRTHFINIVDWCWNNNVMLQLQRTIYLHIKSVESFKRHNEVG